MTTVLSLLILVLGFQDVGDGLVMKAVSLRRQDLPEHFPYQLLSEKFAVLRVTLTNNSKTDLTFRVDELEAYSKKGKRIKRALPTDITPKILKYYTGITGYSGHPEEKSTLEELSGDRTIGVRTDQPMVMLDTVNGLRSVLEGHQLEDSSLGPGETLEAFYYLKSKAAGNKISGGWLLLEGIKAGF